MLKTTSPEQIVNAITSAQLIHTFNIKFLQERCKNTGIDELHGWEIYKYSIIVEDILLEYECEIKVTSYEYKVTIKLLKYREELFTNTKVLNTSKLRVNITEMLSEVIYSQCTKISRSLLV